LVVNYERLKIQILQFGRMRLQKLCQLVCVDKTTFVKDMRKQGRKRLFPGNQTFKQQFAGYLFILLFTFYG